mmetsp:Transcript_45804/g.141570  ORF Transcript_45804/g.141570 Transcript_45804/m.141570 type:complete len:230 (-) Transcript_45804:29-718(-)
MGRPGDRVGLCRHPLGHLRRAPPGPHGRPARLPAGRAQPLAGPEVGADLQLCRRRGLAGAALHGGQPAHERRVLPLLGGLEGARRRGPFLPWPRLVGGWRLRMLPWDEPLARRREAEHKRSGRSAPGAPDQALDEGPVARRGVLGDWRWRAPHPDGVLPQHREHHRRRHHEDPQQHLQRILQVRLTSPLGAMCTCRALCSTHGPICATSSDAIGPCGSAWPRLSHSSAA